MLGSNLFIEEHLGIFCQRGEGDPEPFISNGKGYSAPTVEWFAIPDPARDRILRALRGN